MCIRIRKQSYIVPNGNFATFANWNLKNIKFKNKYKYLHVHL